MITDNTKKLMLFILPPIFMVPLFLFFLAWIIAVTQGSEIDQDSIIQGYHIIEQDQIVAQNDFENQGDLLLNHQFDILSLQQAHLREFKKVFLAKEQSGFGQVLAHLQK